MSSESHPYTMIVGLEVHVQLLTETKLFCGCKTKFGEPPNTQTCPICIGMPGVLPVMNRKAFDLALRTALALNCQIATFTKWDRKNYYYPDLPKGYQISQYDLPFSSDGFLMIEDPEDGQEKRVGIIRAHLEEDAGKSMHDEQAGTADSRVDLNRTGTPLVEIVSQPDIRSPAHARAYLTDLRLLLTYLGVSDCNMQEGSLRVDANVNLHIDTPDGRIATPIVEVKNMNSFSAVERALHFEGERQYKQWQADGVKLGDPGVSKETRGWDDVARITRLQRRKEDVSDYRYFPEPDLVPVVVTEAEVESLRQQLGELPQALRKRLQADFDLSAYDAEVLVNQGQELVNYYLELARSCGDGKMASNWVQQDVLRTLKERDLAIAQFPLPPEQLAALVGKVQKKELDLTRARDVFNHMVDHPNEDAEAAMAALGIEQVAADELETLCKDLLAANPQVVADVKEGKQKAIGAMIGQAKKRNPNINPGEFRNLCLKLIEGM